MASKVYIFCKLFNFLPKNKNILAIDLFNFLKITRFYSFYHRVLTCYAVVVGKQQKVKYLKYLDYFYICVLSLHTIIFGLFDQLHLDEQFWLPFNLK